MNLKRIDYNFSYCTVRYLVNEDTGEISLLLLPKGQTQDCFEERREWLKVPELVAIDQDSKAWHVGNLVHIATRNEPQGNGAGNTLKYGASNNKMRFNSQTTLADGTKKTELISEDGYTVFHYLRPCDGEKSFEVYSEFLNSSDDDIVLDLLTSFSLDNLSPYDKEDAQNLTLHRFRGGWSMEGAHISDSITQLNLACPWIYPFPESERFGVLGSHPVKRYFPVCAIEDTKNGVFWGASLDIAASWQMELSRDSDCYSLSGGIADVEFSGWQQTVSPGNSFKTPCAFISTAKSLDDLCDNLTDVYRPLADQQPKSEDSLPMIFNEWCTTWGAPSHDRMLSLADSLIGSPIKYIVIDAGWTKVGEKSFGQGGNGEWIVDQKKFPEGVLATSRALKEKGFKTGIWFEFEVTTKGARVYESDYDHMHLKRNGKVIASGDNRSFWDFRNPEVIKFLYERVIKFLRDNEIGYLKVDYNGSIGTGCDDAQTAANGLHEHINAVLDFFSLIRKELPDLVFESCSSGGHRLVAPFFNRTAMSSFSDAHEGKELPLIGARLARLALPRQLQLWSVLQPQHSIRELQYRISSGFLGRWCVSGSVDKLDEKQLKLLHSSMKMYEGCTDIIKSGYSRLIHEYSGQNIRHPKGFQVAARYAQDENSALVVFHSFEDQAAPIEFELEQGDWDLTNILHDDLKVSLNKNKVTIYDVTQFSATVIIVQKK